jgi:hypothetical protein
MSEKQAMSEIQTEESMPSHAAPPRKARRQRSKHPTLRDFGVFKSVVICQQHLATVGMNFEISSSRVCQIVAKVRRWLAEGGVPADRTIRDHLALQKLARSANRMRLCRVIEQATLAIEQQLPSQKTIRSRYHGTTEVWRDETSKFPEAVNLPALRLLLRAVDRLDDFDKTTPEPPPQAAEPSASREQLLASVFEFLCRWRLQEEHDGHLPHADDVGALVAANLSQLLGIGLDAKGHITATREPAQKAKLPAEFSALSRMSSGANDELKSLWGETLNPGEKSLGPKV